MGAALQTVVRDRSKRAPLRRRTLRIRPERPPCRACPAKVLSVSYCRFLLADWLMISLHTSSISQNLCRLCQLRLDLSSGSARKTGLRWQDTCHLSPVVGITRLLILPLLNVYCTL